MGQEECKDGGWVGFGEAFKNQGACVSLLEHLP